MPIVEAPGQVGLSPRQAAPLYDTTSDIVLLAGGVGAGKTMVGGLFPLVRMVHTPLLWFIGPDYDQSRPEFLELLKFCQKLNLVEDRDISIPKVGPCGMKTKLGMEVQCKTAADVLKLAARGPTGIVITEPAQHTGETLLRAIERVSRSEARHMFKPWIFICGVFESDQGWFVDYYKLFQTGNDYHGKSYSVASWDNWHLYPEGYHDPEIQKMRKIFPADIFNQKYAGIPAKAAGLVLPEFNHTVHVRLLDLDASRPVELGIDPGYGGSHYAVLAIQRLDDKRVHILDEIFIQHQTTEEVIAAARSKPWWNRVTGGWIDIAGRQHHANASVIEIWRQAGVHLQSQKVWIADNVERLRTCLNSENWLTFSPSCKGLFLEFGKWKRRAGADGVLLNDPEDQNCDAVKALGYWLYGTYGPVEYGKRKASKPAPMFNHLAREKAEGGRRKAGRMGRVGRDMNRPVRLLDVIR